MTSLFDPITIGGLTLSNRIMMAPMTRGRGTDKHVPLPRMADYYAQRASAGLIITEAAPISRQGAGWPYSPGLWSEEQVAAWQPVTQAVHEAGGRIVVQLWHMGRVVHPAMAGEQPVSASATTAPGEAHSYEGRLPHVEARPLAVEEVPSLIADYVHAAKNAIRAGFDGVQLHGANGYIIDQFLRDSSNLRDDGYGGSIENRARLLLETTQALVDAIGKDRVSVRLSPNGGVQGVIDSNPEPLFAHAARELDRIGISFLELRESREDTQPPVSPVIRASFGGVLVLNGGYGLDDGNEAVASGRADAISYGKPYIANPDLVERFRAGHPLAEAKPGATVYAPVDEGYADYPRYETVSA